MFRLSLRTFKFTRHGSKVRGAAGYGLSGYSVLLLGLAACNTTTAPERESSANAGSSARASAARSTPTSASSAALAEALSGGSQANATHSPTAAGTEGNPELSRALQQAAAAKAAGAGAEGPPANGILGKERAEKEAPAGSAPNLVVKSFGAEPRVKLTAPDLSHLQSKRVGQLEMALTLGENLAAPQVALKLEVAAKPKSKAEPASGALAIEVVSADLSKTQPGELPPDTHVAVSKLKGSQFFVPWQDGAPRGAARYEPAKNAPENLELVLAAATDVLPTLLYLAPSEAVGTGATWMVTAREAFLGTDVVAYRLYRVQEVTPEHVVLQITTQRYSAGGKLGLPGIAEHEVLQFQASDQAQLRLVPGHSLPAEAQIEQHLLAELLTADERSSMALDSRTLLAFPPERAAAPPVATR